MTDHGTCKRKKKERKGTKIIIIIITLIQIPVDTDEFVDTLSHPQVTEGSSKTVTNSRFTA
jgi:hypothetical protein